MAATWYRIPEWASTVNDAASGKRARAWVYLLGTWHAGNDPGPREVMRATGYGAATATALLPTVAAWARDAGSRLPERWARSAGTPTEQAKVHPTPEVSKPRNAAGTVNASNWNATRARVPLLRSEEIRTEEIPEWQTTSTQPQPEPAPMSTSDDLEAAANGYRNGRTAPNLSFPEPTEQSGVCAPDGREVPATWAQLLRPLALAAMPRDAARIGEMCRLMRGLDTDPADMLRIPADEWRYVRGLGLVAAGRLADLATRAGWPPGLLVVAPIRKMTESEALQAITGEESQRWEDAGCRRDPITGACIVPPLLTLLASAAGVP